MLESADNRTSRKTPLDSAAVPLWQPLLLAALAGGMGWGIRGQYGHETGAMIAGLLVSLVLVFLLCPQAALLPAARAVAMGTIAIGFGGSMTYGQTIGLTHDAPLIGNWAALRWGMLGLAIKGGISTGFAGLFLGLGLGGVRYRAREILLLMLGMLVLAEFASVPGVGAYYDLGLILGLIPMVAVASGRWWPFLLILPITVVPIAGKTIRQLVYREQAIGLLPGWLLYGVLPLVLTTLAAIWFARQIGRELSRREFARRALLLCTWLYFGLNFAFVSFPLPWAAWTSRTPNALAFTICAVGLTLAAIRVSRERYRLDT